jgi:type I restriction enzyme S subunit
MSNKAEKRGLVPKLRFPEFRDSGEWEKKELRKVAAIINKKAGNNKYTLMSITSGVGLVSQLEKFGREIAGAQYKNYLVIEKNDFAYNKSATKEYSEGFIGMYSGRDPGAVPNSIFTCFRVDANTVSPKYLDYLFIGNLHGKWLKKFITVGARAHGSLNIDDNDLLAMPVPLPQGDHSITEQQKIADCFASLDELITLEAQKLDTLKTHKKGLMQQLFPAEGETLPKLRFPEFREAGRWEERRLNDVCERIMDGTHFSPKSKSGSCLYLTSKNIQNGAIELSNISYISEEEHRQIYERCPVKKNDVLLTKDGANTGNCAINGIDFEFSLLSSVAVLRGNSLCLDQGFLYQLILSDRTQKSIQESMSGQAITRITLEKIGNFSIPVTSIPEQQKIADCLASLDDLITAQTQKLAGLKTHKKGLMQQLFPALDEAAA